MSLFQIIHGRTGNANILSVIAKSKLLLGFTIDLAIQIGNGSPNLGGERAVGFILKLLVGDLLRRETIETAEVDTTGRTSILVVCRVARPTLNAARVEEMTTLRHKNNRLVLAVFSLIVILLVLSAVVVLALYEVMLADRADLLDCILDGHVALDVVGDKVGHSRERAECPTCGW
jgi:hypothetical protein